ncbi:sulfate adenylyltransferase subunit CysD [Oligoflexus tunisiensis]|uniref:sulfate adenylyltransferase subunit CysD n=1 Tax=Oligoflexus tunisiensis TaxID=708132 RepID=UPI000AAFBD38|nr:sulfate adenylyltransferase subunit CysD [Oligoflexus tunisiensis]
MKVGPYTLSYLDQLEAESIMMLREAVAAFSHPVLLYSVGKDSSVLLRLCQKAFYPGEIPFPVVHVDTGFKFQEMYDFRDEMVARLGLHLVVGKNAEAIAQGTNPYALGTQKCCALLKTRALVQTLSEAGFDCAIGGARRDEEKSRAKERVFSFRDKFGQWDPKLQRPELWDLFNTKINEGESIRVFPLSNWTELNIWQYIAREKIPIVPLYFAKEREVFVRGQQLIPLESGAANPHETPEKVMCRFRTLGCSPCTGAIRSTATTIEAIIEEMMTIRVSERMTRIIDHDTEGSMELKKREGYF